MKKRNKISAVFLTLSMLFAVLSGCAHGNIVNLKSSMEIPENGIISQQIFNELKESNDAIVFSGSDNGINYQWTIFGSDIVTAQQLDLRVFVEQRENESISLSFATETAIDFSPVLSVYVPEKWAAQTATVFKVENDGKTALCGASLTSGNPTIINFSVLVTAGEFIISGDKISAEVNESGNDSSLSDSQQSGSADNNNSQKTDDGYLSAPSQQTGNSASGGGLISTGENSSTNPVQTDSNSSATDDYLSSPSGGSSGGGSSSKGEKDQYLTDPIPAGKPKPVEPQDTTVDSDKTLTCTFSIECSTILNNLEDLNPEKLEVLPSNGIILKKMTVTFSKGESVYDVLLRLCRDEGIHMESSWTPMYNSAYVEGIHNLYEFDCGELSGWMYRVNGWYPNYGASRYQLKQGDVVEWRYTCDLGRDVGCNWNLTGG